jgi:hypothetical protein
MAASDDLKKLSDRAKVAEDHAAAARNQARAELEQSVTHVRESAEAEAKKLQAKTQAAGQRASDSWSDVQASWNAHLAKARKDVDQRKAEFNASNAEDRADSRSHLFPFSRHQVVLVHRLRNRGAARRYRCARRGSRQSPAPGD